MTSRWSMSEINEYRGDKDAISKAIGRTIERAEFDKENETLRINFTDGSKLALWDDGQCCCENRYMVVDDSLCGFNGAKLVKVETVDGPDQDERYDVHEVQFLNIETSLGLIQAASHNEHNGYYGGFG